jgi:hypothetical protein
MQMLRYRPAAPLSAFIDQFWYVRGCDPDRKRRSALPTGSVDLTFNLAADDLQVFANAADHVGMTSDGAVVHGAQSKYFVLDARRDIHVLGVHFRPGGGAGLLGVNAQELTDRHIALSDIWGARAHTLRHQLLEAPTPAAKFALLEQEFLSRLHPRPLVHPAISFALRGMRTAPTELRIAQLQTSTGYSPRRSTSPAPYCTPISGARFWRKLRSKPPPSRCGRRWRSNSTWRADAAASGMRWSAASCAS